MFHISSSIRMYQKYITTKNILMGISNCKMSSCHKNIGLAASSKNCVSVLRCFSSSPVDQSDEPYHLDGISNTEQYSKIPPLHRVSQWKKTLPDATNTDRLVLTGERKDAIKKLDMKDVPILYKKQERRRRRYMERLDKAQLPTIIDEFGNEKKALPMIQGDSYVNSVDLKKERENFLEVMTGGNAKLDFDKEFYNHLDKRKFFYSK